jgi:hypothetical protein
MIGASAGGRNHPREGSGDAGGGTRTRKPPLGTPDFNSADAATRPLPKRPCSSGGHNGATDAEGIGEAAALAHAAFSEDGRDATEGPGQVDVSRRPTP